MHRKENTTSIQVHALSSFPSRLTPCAREILASIFFRKISAQHRLRLCRLLALLGPFEEVRHIAKDAKHHTEHVHGRKHITHGDSDCAHRASSSKRMESSKFPQCEGRVCNHGVGGWERRSARVERVREVAFADSNHSSDGERMLTEDGDHFFDDSKY